MHTRESIIQVHNVSYVISSPYHFQSVNRAHIAGRGILDTKLEYPFSFLLSQASGSYPVTCYVLSMRHAASVQSMLFHLNFTFYFSYVYDIIYSGKICSTYIYQNISHGIRIFLEVIFFRVHITNLYNNYASKRLGILLFSHINADKRNLRRLWNILVLLMYRS